MRPIILRTVAVLFILACGCSYRMEISELAPGSIFVKSFRNKTFYHGFDENFNFALHQVLLIQGSFEPVNDESVSDYILSGDIASIGKSVIRSGKNNLPIEYQFKCKIMYILEGKQGDKFVTRRSLTRSWRYIPPIGETEQSVLGKLSLFLAEELLRDMQQNW